MAFLKRLLNLVRNTWQVFTKDPLALLWVLVLNLAFVLALFLLSNLAGTILTSLQSEILTNLGPLASLSTDSLGASEDASAAVYRSIIYVWVVIIAFLIICLVTLAAFNDLLIRVVLRLKLPSRLIWRRLGLQVIYGLISCLALLPVLYPALQIATLGGRPGIGYTIALYLLLILLFHFNLVGNLLLHRHKEFWEAIGKGLSVGAKRIGWSMAVYLVALLAVLIMLLITLLDYVLPPLGQTILNWTVFAVLAVWLEIYLVRTMSQVLTPN